MGQSSHPAGPEQLPAIDTTVPHSARFWDYLLGGKENYPVDREVGAQVLLIDPDLPAAARAGRGFLFRAVRYLAGEVEIRQFLDIGTGLPTANNTHQVAQAAVPECRIVYVDNDPLVLAHARALLTSTPQGATAYLHADVREPDRILQEAARTLDFTQPVALMLLGIINYIMDTAEAHTIVSRLLGALPSGSYLAISHPTAEVHGEAVEEIHAVLELQRRGPDQDPQPPGSHRLLRQTGAVGTRRGLMFVVASGAQRRRNPCRGTSVLRGGTKALISPQHSLSVLFRNLVVSVGDLAWTHKRSMITR